MEGTPHCPYCDSTDIIPHPQYPTLAYWCNGCNRPFIKPRIQPLSVQPVERNQPAE